MVVMLQGVLNKKEYRHFIIDSLKDGEIDDFKSLYEVLGRRAKKIEKDCEESNSDMTHYIYEKLTKKKLQEYQTLYPDFF
ncbi:excinuclease ABC subunit C [Candidatus Venteria ishoeyi]|uniref:Excinuclease ABC subunit C n=2 Tax=Candidatus Venteria ishoeyi TaxID=1899563 RepID=A0A1H6F4J7_9GAMM|nr:excinuclease ABC subunit C [Candidatus Venteria ishoeyi]